MFIYWLCCQICSISYHLRYGFAFVREKLFRTCVSSASNFERYSTRSNQIEMTKNTFLQLYTMSWNAFLIFQIIVMHKLQYFWWFWENKIILNVIATVWGQRFYCPAAASQHHQWERTLHSKKKQYLRTKK